MRSTDRFQQRISFKPPPRGQTLTPEQRELLAGHVDTIVMSAILEIPEVRQRVSRLSVEEYHRLDEFNEQGRRTELIRGIVIEKMSKSPLHSSVAKRRGPARIPLLKRQSVAALALGCGLVFVIVLTVLQTAAAESWTQMLPFPESRNLLCLIYANGTYYAAGAKGAVLTSEDSASWIVRDAGSTNGILAATTGNGLILLATSSELLLSSDGLNWQKVATPASDGIGALIFGRDQFVLFGGGGSIAASTNGVDWVVHRAPDFWERFQGAVYGNGAFIGFSAEGILYSPDGSAWQKVYTRVIGDSPHTGIYADGHFTAGTRDGRLFASDTGRDWTEVSAQTPAALTQLLHDGSEYLAVLNNGGGFAASPDGTNWTKMDSPIYLVTQTALFANGRLVLAGDGGGIAAGRSVAELGVVNPGRIGLLADIAAGPNGFIAVGGRMVLFSSDGLAWRGLPVFPPINLLFVRYSRGRFFVGAEAGAFLTSTNGVDWQQSSINTGCDLLSLATDGSLEVLISGCGVEFYSTNGTTWAVGTGDLTGAGCITWGDEVWVAVGGERSITSTNGIAWQTHFISPGLGLKSVTYAQGQFVAVGSGGAVCTSPDGTVWTRQPAPTTNHLTSVTFFNGVYLAAVEPSFPRDPTLGILTSTNGINWSPDSLILPSAIGLRAISHDAQVAFAVGSGGYLYRLGALPQPTVNLQREGDTLRFAVEGNPGGRFTLERSEELAAWSASALVLHSGKLAQFGLPFVPGVAQQFFRALVK